MLIIGIQTSMAQLGSRLDDDLPFDPNLSPFFHGVASGDPLQDRVIIWTRITTDATGPVSVDWEIAEDTAFVSIISTGTATTDMNRDYTIKVDVTGLRPETTYYYRFKTVGKSSLIGRTRTAPELISENLKFAVVSCSDYQSGYFSAYGHIADRNDLDAVIHLGDYIYEYPDGRFQDTTLMRDLVPENELLTIADYRSRYSLYRLDNDLRRAHQQHPFIVTWDDHEIANNSWQGGAQNHQEDEGPWKDRLNAAKRAYLEWMPIRETVDSVVYRKIGYGGLADIIILDTRIEGREEQVFDVNSPIVKDSARTILGVNQRNWFKTQLQNSTAQWKIVAQQVIFSPFNVGFFSQTNPDSVESQFMDIWDGYPAERNALIRFISEENIDNTVFLTGDIHTAFAFDVTESPTVDSLYNPTTGEGSVAVEFVGASITSGNFDEAIGPAFTSILEQCVQGPCPPFFGTFSSPNPHMKFGDLDRHGYFILDLTPERAQSDYFFIDNVRIQNSQQQFDRGLFTADAANTLSPAPAASPDKPEQQVPAPSTPPLLTSNQGQYGLKMLRLFPNPVRSVLFLQYGLLENESLELELHNIQGKTVWRKSLDNQAPGIYDQVLNFGHLPPALYTLHFRGKSVAYSKKIIIE